MKKYGFLFLWLLGMQFLQSEVYLPYLNISGQKTVTIVDKPTASDLLISAVVSSIVLTCATELMDMVQNRCKRSVGKLNNIKEENRTLFNYDIPCCAYNGVNACLVIPNFVASVLKLYPVLLVIAAGYTVADEITK